MLDTLLANVTLSLEGVAVYLAILTVCGVVIYLQLRHEYRARTSSEQKPRHLANGHATAK